MRDFMGKRKTKVIVLIILFVFQPLCFAKTVWINNALNIPEFPTNIDDITISVSGQASKSSSYVFSSQFYQDEDELQLDLFVNMGNFDVVSNWSHYEPIGFLTPDDYTLIVYAYDYRDNTLQDEYSLNFTVTPEPSTFLIFSFGILALRLKKFRKN
jgi:hypothetical protein